jgi:hypothetical protein
MNSRSGMIEGRSATSGFGVLWGEGRALTTGGRKKMRSAPLSL